MDIVLAYSGLALVLYEMIGHRGWRRVIAGALLLKDLTLLTMMSWAARQRHR